MPIKLRGTRPAYLDQEQDVARSKASLEASLASPQRPAPAPERQPAPAAPQRPAPAPQRPAKVVQRQPAPAAPQRPAPAPQRPAKVVQRQPAPAAPQRPAKVVQRQPAPATQHPSQVRPPKVLATGASHRSSRGPRAARRKNATQFNFRLPAKLAALVRSFADRRGMALNSVGIAALAGYVGSG